MAEEQKLPKRPEAHVTGDRAVRVFEYYCRPEWVVNSVRSDYGFDITITTERRGTVQDLLLAQLKGSKSPDYSADSKHVSVEMKVSTINHLLKQPCLTIICICDTAKSDEPIFWGWLHELVEGLGKKKNWQTQETVSIKILTSNKFDQTACEDIEKYLSNYYRDQGIGMAILEVLQPAMGEERSPGARTEHDPDMIAILARRMKPFKEAGIIEIIQEEEDKERIEAYSPEDQTRFRKIQEISNTLNELRDLEADQALSELSRGIEGAADGIKAKYHNNLGVLSLHKGDSRKAIEEFEISCRLRPKEQKYITNLLTTQFSVAFDSKCFESSLPIDWMERLEHVLAYKPEFCPALRLKASWLCFTAGTRAGEEFLRTSKCWQTEKEKCCIHLAGTFDSLGDLDNALRLLNEVNIQENADDPVGLSLYANILLKKAIDFTSTEDQILLKGSGPSKLDLSLLKKSEQCYRRVFTLYREKSFPHISETSITNYTTVLYLLDDLITAESICTEYLNYHPDSIPIHGALASCLVHQDKMIPDKIKHAEIAFKGDSSSTNYRNLAFSYFQIEDYEALIPHISSRQKQGFLDYEEEAISLALAAIANKELGEIDRAQEILHFMESKPDFLAELLFAKEVIAKRENASPEQIRSIFADALEKNPENPLILTHYVHSFDTITKQNASEMVSSIETLRKHRQLVSREISLLAEAFLLLGQPEVAEAMLASAIERYPKDLRLVYLRAKSQIELGDEEGSFKSLKDYMEHGQKTFEVLHNLAFLAYETERLDEAITLFERSLLKAKEKRERGLIHFYLYELRKRRGDTPKTVMRHAIEYGKTVESVDEEARFLMMFLLSPPVTEKDEEVEIWISEARIRLEKFSKEHPRFQSFYSIPIPSDLPKEKIGSHILSHIHQIMLPHYLAAVPLTISARSEQWPLSFRAKYLPSVHSLFDYWTTCTKAEDFANAIHIWYPDNHLDAEQQTVARRDSICIDITALLTLAEFKLLHLLSTHFKRIILARGTKRTIQEEVLRYGFARGVIEEIETWRLDNRHLIRVRNDTSSDKEDEERSSYIKTPSGILLKREEALSVLIPYGVGESVLLAKGLKIPLYCDDSAVRKIGKDEYGIDSFCTITLIMQLRREGKITILQESSLFAEMIRSNFRIVPFDVLHLTEALKEIWYDVRATKKTITREMLQNDRILGAMFRQFGESSLDEIIRMKIAVNWWFSILEDGHYGKDTLVECMVYPLFCFSMQTRGGVLGKIMGDEHEKRVASVLAFFLLRTFQLNRRLMLEAWLSVKQCVEELFMASQKTVERVIYHHIPNSLFWGVKGNATLSSDEKVSCLGAIASSFPQVDRMRLEQELAKKIGKL